MNNLISMHIVGLEDTFPVLLVLEQSKEKFSGCVILLWDIAKVYFRALTSMAHICVRACIFQMSTNIPSGKFLLDSCCGIETVKWPRKVMKN